MDKCNLTAHCKLSRGHSGVCTPAPWPIPNRDILKSGCDHSDLIPCYEGEWEPSTWCAPCLDVRCADLHERMVDAEEKVHKAKKIIKSLLDVMDLS